MDKLPQELVDQISSHLDRDQLKHTLTVNSQFQIAAERCSGAFKKFDLSKATVSQFLDIYSGRRFHYLRNVTFAPILPDPERLVKKNYEKSFSSHCRHSLEELRKFDEYFTREIHFLFSTLKTLENSKDERYHLGNIRLTIKTPIMELDTSEVCLHYTHVSWRIHLLAPEELPELKCVRSLRVENGAAVPFSKDLVCSPARKLDLRVILDISSKFQNLESLACSIGGDEWPNPFEKEVASHLMHIFQGPRRDSRHDFAKVSIGDSVPHLGEAQLNFIAPHAYVEDINQRQQMPNLTLPSQYDPFSSSLRLLSYQLRRMCLYAVVDETLFWPKDGSTQSWPYLESINVRFHMAAPSGTWYFHGFRGEGRIDGYELDASSYPPLEQTKEDECWDAKMDYIEMKPTTCRQFRVVPDNSTLTPLIAGFAEATAFMPSLQKAVLWCPLTFGAFEVDEFNTMYLDDKKAAWGIAYAMPSAKLFCDTEDGSYCSVSRQLWWKVGSWRPDKDLHELFQQIGSQQHGSDLIEYWADRNYNDGLFGRSVFEDYERREFPEFNNEDS